MRFILATLVLCAALAIVLTLWFNSAWDKDAKDTRDYCHSLNAEPVFTKNTHAICVTGDGRVVGSR